MRATELLKNLRMLDAKGYWLVTRAQLRVLFPDESPSSLRESLARHVRSGMLIKVAHKLYANPSPRSRGAYPLEDIVSYLRPLEMNYLSVESVLSERGVISQIMFDYLTVMTSGNGHTYNTPYGTIEFTRTKRPVAEIRDQVFYDSRRKINVATTARAYGDLKRLGRNLDMVNKAELEECIELELATSAGVEPGNGRSSTLEPSR